MYATSRLDGIYVDDTTATKAYADAAAATKLPLAGGTMTGALVVLAGSGNNDAVNVSQIKTGSLGRTAWASGELIENHLDWTGSSSSPFPTIVIAANTTTSLFGANSFTYTPVSTTTKLILKFTFQIVSNALSLELSGFKTDITNQGVTRSFLHNCYGSGSGGGRGQQVTCKMITSAASVTSNPVVITITTTTASTTNNTLSVNNTNWTLSVDEYAA